MTILSLLLVLAVAADDSPRLLTEATEAIGYDYCAWHYDQRPDGAVTAPLTWLPDAPEENAALRAVVDGGIAVARGSSSRAACRQAFARGYRTFETFYRDAGRRMAREAQYASADDEELAAVQRAIARLWVADQTSRLVWIQLRDGETGPGLWAGRLAFANSKLVDAEAARTMTALLERFDWIDRHRFGHRTANQAWLLVQHADDHVELQELALARMHRYLEDGGVRRQDYAHLYDRVALNKGGKQRYGTQPIWACGEEGLALAPLEAPAAVDERRAAMGLDSLADGLSRMSATVCGIPGDG